MMTLRMVSIGLLMVLVNYTPGICQDFKPPPTSITTPDKVESRIGALEFKDGVPSEATAEKVYDNLDFTYAFRAFTDAFQGVSVEAIRQGFESAGIKD